MPAPFAHSLSSRFLIRLQARTPPRGGVAGDAGRFEFVAFLGQEMEQEMGRRWVPGGMQKLLAGFLPTLPGRSVHG